MQVPLLKCHGSGNDFPLIDARELVLADAAWAAVARGLADRTGPVGGDGLLLLTAGDAEHAFGMRMFNPDGSEAETCLNGLRCVARAGFASLGIDRASVRLATSSVAVAVDAELAPGVATIREVAGPVELDVTGWPLLGMGQEVVEQPVPMLPGGRRFTAIGIGNPHLVCFVEPIDEDELIAIGEVCEAAPGWLPNRANVSFVAERPGGLFVRTFERGVGLTDSCGSAMAASTFAACLTGRVGFGTLLTVYNKGGLVRTEAGADGMVELSGNATWEWRGTVEIDAATGAVGRVEMVEEFAEEKRAWAQVANQTG